jgi:Uma2 family endonuclease
MDVHEKLYTADDLLNMPQEDGKRYELIRGNLIERTPANETHGEIGAVILYLLGAFVYPKKLGRLYTAETGFELFQNPDTILAPDVAFVSAARLKPRTDKFATIAPDLAVEIVSPSNTKQEMHEKVALYFQAGTRLVWIVYPKSRAIYVYRAEDSVTILKPDGILDGGDVLPGFSVKVADIFSVLDES